MDPNGEDVGPSKGSDVKSKLAELANRKRKEAEEEAERARQQKKQKKQVPIDFGDDSDDEELPGDARQDPNAPPDDDEADRRELQVTEEDRAFIDDTGLAPDERIDFGDDDDDQLRFEEAEEAAEEDAADELDRLFSKRRRRDADGNEAEAKAQVDSFLAQMEVAVEEDLRQFESGRPAVNKLLMLSRVEEVLSSKKLHNELLDGGLLGVLKAWIEPMPDGTLPNSKVRGTVLRLLGQLPVDCSFEDRREQLKRSGLGKIVMFLFKVPDETPSNRRMAKELIERWSRPMLAPRTRGVDAEEQDRILAARQARQARLRQQEAHAAGGDRGDGDDGEEGAAPLKPGDPGFRYHAWAPQAASLDYVRRPESKFAMPEQTRGGAKDKAGEHKLSKKLKGMVKKAGSGRAAKVSVEGRDVTIRH